MEECKPLTSLEEVLAWYEKDDWARFVLPLKPKTKYCFSGNDYICCDEINGRIKILRSDAPKTLICHDMKGGYLNDRFVNTVESSDEYFFSHWSAADIFVYFSHHLVTIPPVMWINAGHKHGVLVLGTLITEFQNGEKVWAQLFQDDDKLLAFADKLCTICAHYKFDGYLINIENKINPSDLSRLMSFLRRLKQKLLRHDCLLIWYDSVSLINGELSWKNELNEHNRDAFALCDGIFLNYGWKFENLKRSRLRAGARQHDVFVGIDVFGRGCFGGGGYNSDKAAAVARAYGLSIALFGTGWTYEVGTSSECVPEGTELCKKTEIFKGVEQKFWSKLWPFLYVSGPVSLPFKTAFCQGYGKYLFDQGEKTKSVPWYNLSSQCYQSSITFCSNDETGDNSCVSHTDDDGYLYGGSIVINRNIPQTNSIVCNLFICDFVCEKDNPLLLSVASKWPSLCEPFNIVFILEKYNFRRSVYVVIHHPDYQPDLHTQSSPIEDYSILPDSSKFVSSLKCSNDWFLSKYLLKLDGHIIAIKLETKQNILLGLLSMESGNFDETGKF